MTTHDEHPNDIIIERIDPEGWNPIIGDDMPEYIARIAKSTGSTEAKVVESFHKPDHEFSLTFPAARDLAPIAENIRLMAHEFGPMAVFTVWDTNEYVYHATVQMRPGLDWADAAGQIFQRWIQTMPQVGGAFGSGKTRVH